MLIRRNQLQAGCQQTVTHLSQINITATSMLTDQAWPKIPAHEYN
jgi:hypothetical protein